MAYCKCVGGTAKAGVSCRHHRAVVMKTDGDEFSIAGFGALFLSAGQG